MCVRIGGGGDGVSILPSGTLGLCTTLNSNQRLPKLLSRNNESNAAQNSSHRCNNTLKDDQRCADDAVASDRAARVCALV